MPRDPLRARFDTIIESLTGTEAPPWYRPIQLARWRHEHDRLLVEWLALRSFAIWRETTGVSVED